MIRCEHCGSMLPDGAIFCGECGRAVTAAASRRPVAPPPAEQAPPPPLQQPDLHGRRQDPAADAWLPEATLDPATRAWLTGSDRGNGEPAAPVPVQRPDDLTPRSAPTHVHGAGSGLPDWSRGQDAAAAPEPPLDPDAYPTESSDVARDDGDDDPEVTRVADRSAAPDVTQAPRQVPGPTTEPSAAPPAWAPPAEQTPAPAPAGPSWWVGRSSASASADAVASDDPAADSSGGEARAAEASAADADTVGAPAAGVDAVDPSAAGPSAADGSGSAESSPSGSAGETPSSETPPVPSPPQPGDTAVVEPLVDRCPRRQSRPTPLVAPGSTAATCPVCGHLLEPDDIFCAECGAVRPAVTAAFTGQIVPLPTDRPDWAADDRVAPDHGTESDGAVDSDSDSDSVGDELVRGTGGVLDEHEHEHALDDRTADPRTGPDPESGAASVGAPVLPPIPGSPTVPSSAPAPQDSDGSAGHRAAEAVPRPPVLPLPTTEHAPTSADGDDDGLDEDVDQTRIVDKTPTRAPFVLHFSTGERFGVHGSGLLGRLPRPQPGERFDDLLTVHDPGKSVSKTHLEIGRDGDDLWVSDRFSGNGTVVRHIDGSIRRCEPGRRYRVERGARVDIGEQFFLVQ